MLVKGRLVYAGLPGQVAADFALSRWGLWEELLGMQHTSHAEFLVDAVRRGG